MQLKVTQFDNSLFSYFIIKGVIVYDARRGLYSDELKDWERRYENKANKERKLRRHRKLDESFQWFQH